MKKIFITSFIFWGLSAPVKAQPVCQTVALHLQEGDLVFREIHNFVFEYVARTTNTWASHVGIAFRGHKGEWLVGEAEIPRVRFTPLCNYFKSPTDRAAVRRSKKALTELDIANMRLYVHEQLGKWYNFGFDLNNHKSQFCSKLVFEAFSRAKIGAGDRQSFANLMESVRGRPDESELVRFWKFFFMGEIPYSRETVTPASQYFDDDFETIFESEA